MAKRIVKKTQLKSLKMSLNTMNGTILVCQFGHDDD